jgi:hypothetical protein
MPFFLLLLLSIGDKGWKKEGANGVLRDRMECRMEWLYYGSIKALLRLYYGSKRDRMC